MPCRQNKQPAGSVSRRKSYAPQFKLDRAAEAIRNNNLSEISRKYGLAVNLISKWRSQLLEQGARLFETSPDQEVNLLKAKIAKLEQMVGKKEIELNLIKNFSDFYQSQNMT
jgi:transposase